MGHEFSGVVVDCGEAALSKVAKGDRVAIDPNRSVKKKKKRERILQFQLHSRSNICHSGTATTATGAPEVWSTIARRAG